MSFSRHLPAVLVLVAMVAAAAAAQPRPAGAPITLERTVTLARDRSERVRQADASADAADARVDRARSFFFPDVALSGTYSLRPSNQVRDSHTFAASLDASITVFDGRALPAYRQSQAERDAARLDAEQVARLVGYEAADAFLQTLGLEQVALAAERRLAFARERLRDAEARAEAKLASSNDVTRAQLEVADAERAVTTATATLADAYLRLGDLVGAEVGGPLAVPAELLAAARRPIDAGAGERLWTSAEQGRLDLRAGDLRVDSAEQGAKVPSRGFWPTVALTGQARASTFAGFGGEKLDWLIGVSASWDLWDGGERAADQRAADAGVRFAEASLAEDRRGARLELRRAVTALASAQTTLGQAEAQVALARKNADEVIVLYNQGLARAIEVADANQLMFDADVALAQAGYGLAIAYLQVRLSLGLEPLGAEVAW